MFSANTASGSGPAYGGGAICSDSRCTLNLTNCTFGGNSAVSYGGAIYDSNGFVYLDNSILWANTATYGQQIALQNGPTVSIIYCDIPNTPDAVFEEQPGVIQWGPGNIHDDPLFIDLGNDNLRLYDGSPCIDAGANFALPPDIHDLDDDGDTAERTPLDIDGELRFSDDPATPNTGVPDPPDYPDIVDIGADEYGPCGSPGRPYPPGDVNHDCKVDFQDIAIIGDNWLKRS
jgi:predicted outer membrane repeat protein